MTAEPITEDDAVGAPLLGVLDDFGAAVSSQNLDAALATFSSHPDVLLMGSEESEIAKGPESVRSFLEAVLGSDSRVSWEWSTREATVVGSAGYVFAEGEVVVTSHSGTFRKPYRMTGLLIQESEGWRWLCFHGAEPAPS